MRAFVLAGIGVLIGSLAWASEAHATTELPAVYDARSVAMGGTGIGFIENGASVYLNPAAMDGIKTFAATGVFTAFMPSSTAPLLGPGTAVTTESNLSPLFLVGAGYRVHDRVVVGFGVFPTTGIGANYALPGNERLSLAMVKLEAAPAVSIRIVEGLSIGLAYRVTYTKQTVHTPPSPTGAPGTDISVDGTNFFGIQAGAYYRPTERLNLGLTFRSQVGGAMSGSATIAGNKFDATSEFGAPVRLGLGVSYKLTKELMVAADAKYLFYSGSNEALNTRVAIPGSPTTISQPLDWRNVPVFGLGVEWEPLPVLALRAGYSLSKSATPESTASPLAPPPGWINGGHAGVGIKLDRTRIDVGGAYLTVGKKLGGSPIVVPGEYQLNGLIASASVTYSF